MAPMNQAPVSHPALLPSGLRDVLPPEAELEARLVETVMDCFAAHGYQRVKPPLLEFEESLFSGSGAAIAEQTFRLMDPESQRMMGLRADTTPQIARLAATRLGAAPRPLRLAYAGQCLRVRGTQLAHERQIAQAGIELIGVDTAEADAEIILTAAAALASVGLLEISVDLTIPRLVLSVLEGAGIEERDALGRALDRKDHAEVSRLGGDVTAILLQLLEACGPAQRAIPLLLAAGLPEPAQTQAQRMAAVVAAINLRKSDLPVTVDPVEFRGYRYHTGICMTLFAAGRQAELGRGGRYLCGEGEPATGVTLYPDTVIQSVAPMALRPRVYVPFGTDPIDAKAIRARGFATVAGLAACEHVETEAKRLACSHFYDAGSVVACAEDNE
jgi:ATP phosphoribosyltransferase regulatory subunit